MKCPACNGTGQRPSEFWIVQPTRQAGQSGSADGLNYWGPYPSEIEARAARMFRADGNHYVVEVAA